MCCSRSPAPWRRPTRRKEPGPEPLAEEALEIFQDLEVSREAIKAVRFLREACRRKLATAELVQEVVTFLNRLERQPRLRFEM